MKPRRLKRERRVRDPEPDYLAERWEGVSLEEVLARLRSRKKKDRVWAAVLLRSFGREVQPDLIQALEDHDLEVRVAAAQSLGYVGDAAAIEPLSRVLRSCFVARSGRWQRVLSWVLIGMGLALAAAVFFVFRETRSYGGYLLLNIFSWSAGAYFGKCRAMSRLAQTTAEALDRIAERDPTPKLRNVLPDLRAAAADVLNQGKETRRSCRRAAARIASLTEEIKTLPIPTAASRSRSDALPRPASAEWQDRGDLPRAAPAMQATTWETDW